MKTNTEFILDELDSRGIPFEIVQGFEQRYIRVRINNKSVYINGAPLNICPTFTHTASNNKFLTAQIATEIGINVPKRVLPEDVGDEFPPLVVKPSAGAHGDGITLNVTTKPKLMEAFDKAAKFSKEVFAQEQVEGSDLRVMLLEGGIVGAFSRQPPVVSGDGHNNVKELIDIENRYREEHKLSLIDIEEVIDALEADLDHVPGHGEVVLLSKKANLSKGASVIDVTDSVDQAYFDIALKMADEIGMVFGAIDFMCSNFAHPPSEENPYWLIEANLSPGFKSLYQSDPEKVKKLSSRLVEMMIERANQ